MTFAPMIETTISPSMPSMDWRLLLETGMFLFCLAGFLGVFSDFLFFFLEYLDFLFLRFLDLNFFFLLLLELSLLFEELLLALLCRQMIRHRSSLNLFLVHDQNDLP